jgi:hypothetical protein
MRKSLILFFLSTILISRILAQSQELLNMVQLPDSVSVKLSNFLAAKEKLKLAEYPMYIFNLVNSKDFKYHDGIYTFRLIGPHFKRHVFIVNNSEVYMFDGYYIDELLQEFDEYIKNVHLSAKQKIIYLKAIGRFLEEEYKTETSLRYILTSEIAANCKFRYNLIETLYPNGS